MLQRTSSKVVLYCEVKYGSIFSPKDLTNATSSGLVLWTYTVVKPALKVFILQSLIRDFLLCFSLEHSRVAVLNAFFNKVARQKKEDQKALS
jgi:hypothetical protein